MIFSKINDYLEKYKVGVAYSFILVSILSMSSLIYKVANPIYKGLSALVFVFILVSLLGSFKKIKADVKFLILFGLVAGSHLLSALVNRSGNFLGNITEVYFYGYLYFVICYVRSKTIAESISNDSYYSSSYIFFYLPYLH